MKIREVENIKIEFKSQQKGPEGYIGFLILPPSSLHKHTLDTQAGSR